MVWFRFVDCGNDWIAGYDSKHPAVHGFDGRVRIRVKEMDTTRTTIRTDLEDFFQRAFGSIQVQDGRVDPHIPPLHVDCTVYLIRSVVVAVAFAGTRDWNKNVSHIENECIEVDASRTKGMDVLEGK